MIVQVRLWGRTIGAVSLDGGRDYARFQYDPDFAQSEIEVSPIMMPLSEKVYEFPELPVKTFHGLPGLLADSLPDRFGNAVINAWLAGQGRTPESFSAVERLCYIGKRGMGALEFVPALGPRARKATKVEIDALVALASEVLTQRDALQGDFSSPSRKKALESIMQVGTSAGGARAKAVIAWNPDTNEVRSGQTPAGPGFEYWLLKFDGVSGNKDKELDDAKEYGVIEYAYYLMATAAGVRMSECRLLEESGRRHFMTRRFDRLAEAEKLHMQSLCGLAHFDFNQAGAYSYEQALVTIRRLNLPPKAMEDLFRRMVFNIVARNQDDHVKNIAFLMDKDGRWSLAPAFDMTYSFSPDGLWTSMHQMTMNGKRDHFTMADFRACEKVAQMKRGHARRIVEETCAVVRRWPEFAHEAGVRETSSTEIGRNHRLSFSKN